MDHERLADLLFLLGMTSLGAGCSGVIPLEDDGDATDTDNAPTSDGSDTTASMTTAPPPTTVATDVSTTAMATDTATGTSTTDSTGIDFTDSGGRTSDPPATTTSDGTTTTTTFIPEDTTTTTTGIDSTTTTGYAFTSGIFTGGFTSSGTGGPVVFAECEDWAYQYVYCYIPMYPGLEDFFRYYCNTYMVPYNYEYSMACGYAALEHLDCLSTLDCDEWGNVGMGTDCDDTLSAMEMMCGL